MPADENGHSTREACGHPFVTDDCVMCEVDTMKRETANLQRQIKELRTPVEKVTLGGVDMSPNYKGDGVSDGWVPHAELVAARGEIAELRAARQPLLHTDAMYVAEIAAMQAQRDAALGLLREVEPILGHGESCSWDPSRWSDGPTPCDCGLDTFLVNRAALLAGTAEEGKP